MTRRIHWMSTAVWMLLAVSCSGGPEGPASQPACEDDGNPCTAERVVVGACTHVPQEVSCDDGNACSQDDGCQAGVCAGTLQNCDDMSPCTDDGCDKVTGCTHVVNNAACDDDDACTTADICNDASCVGGVPLGCDDQNPCTDDGCDKVAGCTNTANSAACDDGNVCTNGDICAGEVCVGGAPVDCDDENVCTDDTCFESSGCTHVANTATCDDGNACTTGEVCLAEDCTGATVVDCDDGNVCSDDACDQGSGCVHLAKEATCDDGDACTTVDACSNLACNSGPQLSCDDQNPCSDDSCDKGSGCIHLANAATCDDGDACTTVDVCEGGACIGNTAKDCSDGNVCSDDSCDKATGCVNAANDATCDDGDACTTVDACLGKACTGGKAPDCSDGNVCTDDSCDKASGCVHVANKANCDDGNACMTQDSCKNSTCMGSTPLDCDDSQICTDDSCDKVSGCVHVANKADCDDGDACTTIDTCTGKACQGANASSCDDGDVCTDDACDKATGCLHIANTAPCNDGDACTVSDNCVGKACVGSKPPNCDDSNVCTKDTCSKATGCTNVSNTAQCDDGDACTVKDFCASGTCTGGATKNCDDGNPCTKDSCNGAAGCANNAAVDGLECTLGDSCSAGGTCEAGACKSQGQKLFQHSDTNGGRWLDVRKAPGGFLLASSVVRKTNLAGDYLWKPDFVAYGLREEPKTVEALADGYVVAGFVYQTPGYIAGDFWLARLDTGGAILWRRAYGGLDDEQVNDVAVVPGGFVLGGYRHRSEGCAWLVGTDANGAKTWEASLGPDFDDIQQVLPVSDGLVLAGWSGKTGPYLARTDSLGNVLWSKTYGAAGSRILTSAVAVSDGFVLAGETTSSGAGGADAWLVRVDLQGAVVWEKTYGGAKNDRAQGLVAVGDGFAFTGRNGSPACSGTGMWLVRVDAMGNLLWENCYGLSGGAGFGYALDVLSDGFIVAGSSNVNNAPVKFVVRTDAWGNATCLGSGLCAGFADTKCDDGNSCTKDFCDPKALCKHTAHPDGSECGQSKICKSGICQ